MFAGEKAGPVAVQKLIQAGADVNARDQNGESALFHALRDAGEATEEVKLLLAALFRRYNSVGFALDQTVP